MTWCALVLATPSLVHAAPAPVGPTPPPDATDAGPAPASAAAPAPTTAPAPKKAAVPDDPDHQPEDFDDEPIVESNRRSAFDLPPAKRDDPYGPRPKNAPKISREQLVRFALDNPAVAAAEDEVDAMVAQLQKAKFLWVPGIDTSTTLSPGVNVRCDDVLLDNGTTEPFDFQFCRSSDDPNVDVSTVRGYFSQLSRAGVRVAFHADSVIPLFTFGKIKNTKKLAEAGVALKKLQKVATEAETILLVERAYVGLLAAREGKIVLKEAKKVLDRAEKRVTDDLGSADDWDADIDEEGTESERDPNDAIKIALAQIELEQKMREALKLESVALAALWALAGEAAPKGFDVKAERLNADDIDGGLKSMREYQDLAATSRPEAKMAQAGIKARAAQQRLARSAFLPDFGIALGVDSRAVDLRRPGHESAVLPGRLQLFAVHRRPRDEMALEPRDGLRSAQGPGRATCGRAHAGGRAAAARAGGRHRLRRPRGGPAPDRGRGAGHQAVVEARRQPRDPRHRRRGRLRKAPPSPRALVSKAFRRGRSNPPTQRSLGSPVPRGGHATGSPRVLRETGLTGRGWHRSVTVIHATPARLLELNRARAKRV